MKRQNLTGLQFGRLTVIALAPYTGRKPRWRCLCRCGEEVVVESSHLKDGHTQSCGCLYEETRMGARKHGARRTPEHNTWCHIVQRCTDRNDTSFHNYGGRGIKVCERWRDSFEAFLADMGPRPSPQHSIDRKDNDGDYGPGNCRWATAAEQSRNRRQNRFIEHAGETLCLKDWAGRVGIGSGTLSNRLKKQTLSQVLKQAGVQ